MYRDATANVSGWRCCSYSLRMRSSTRLTVACSRQVCRASARRFLDLAEFELPLRERPVGSERTLLLTKFAALARESLEHPLLDVQFPGDGFPIGFELLDTLRTKQIGEHLLGRVLTNCGCDLARDGLSLFLELQQLLLILG